MPSAEKTSSAAVKLESIQQNETKMMENVQKESSAESGTTLFALNQIVSMISNKVRNLEKRKVSTQRSTAFQPQPAVVDAARASRCGFSLFCDFIFFVLSIWRQKGEKKTSEREKRKKKSSHRVCVFSHSRPPRAASSIHHEISL